MSYKSIVMIRSALFKEVEEDVDACNMYKGDTSMEDHHITNLHSHLQRLGNPRRNPRIPA